MKKNIIILIITVLLPLNIWSQETPVMGTLLLNGKVIPAEYRLSGSQATLGSGRNACIPHYSKGRVIVPSTITVEGNTYEVTAVSSMAFRLCNNISFVQLPEGVESIGNFAFKGCTGLIEVVLPSTMLSIGSGAFVDLPRLKAIYCTAPEPPKWEYNDVFCRHEGGIGSTETYSNTTTTLYVPMEKVDAYRNSTFSDANLGWTTPDGWRYFSNIKGTNDYEAEWGLGISTPLALNNFRDRVNTGETFEGKIVKIEADIDMMGHEWESGIGGGGANPNMRGSFKGMFDGQSHTISNLSINISSNNSDILDLGFFRLVDNGIVTNLRIDNFDIISQSPNTSSSGIVAGFSSGATFSNIYVKNSQVHGGGDVGGLVGLAIVSDFNKCVVDNTSAIHASMEGSNNNSGRGDGGLVGYSQGASITDCALINKAYPTSVSAPCIQGPFVGRGGPGTTIDYCYSDTKQFSKFVPTDVHGYTHGEHVVVLGQKIWFSLAGEEREVDISLIRNFMALVPVLGLDNWVYCVGKYPLPDCFEDLYDVQANNFSLRPAMLTTPRPNALSLMEELDDDDWTSGNYRNASFRTSSLWIDDNLNYKDREQIPIGTATIDCTNGVRYDRTLTAPENGTQIIEYPVYQTDEDGMVVLDENGQRIPTGETKGVEETVYEPTAYCFFLPYPMTFSSGIHIYHPTEVKRINDDLAQVTFVEKTDKHADAWTPYYAIVDGPAVPLSTEEHIVINPLEDHAVNAGNGYSFDGTSCAIDRTNKDAYLLQFDKTWQKIGDKILPFRAYFYSTNESQAAILTTFATLLLKDNDDNSVIIDDNDGITTNVTLDGRIFYKDDTWNTLCLPYDVRNFSGTPLEGATVKTLESASFDNITGVMTLNFSEGSLSAIEAGKPYIAKWSSGDNILNPVFRDVTINDITKDVTTDVVMFKGITSPFKIEGEDKTMLYLGADNTLYYPNDEMTIGAFRAYFKLNNGIIAGDPTSPANARAFILNFDGEVTSIDKLAKDSNSGSWYDLQGRKISVPSSTSANKVLPKGVYIHDGKKVVIK